MLAAGVLWTVPSVSSEKPAASKEAKRHVKAPGQAGVGDLTVCPVHPDAAFFVKANTPKTEYKGRTYYFCCAYCADAFAQNPEKYVK
jgi:hypothetical protein